MVAIGMRRAAKCLTLSVLPLILAAPGLSAQSQPLSRPLRVSAISGGMSHGSALVVDPIGNSDTRLSPGPTFGLELQYATFSFGSLYAGLAGSFSTLEHGANLGIAAGSGSNATLILGTAGLVLEASDWFADFRPTLRLGGGLKAYSFTTSGASSVAAFTGDVGVGFRGGAGAIEISGELRYLPSAFDQGKLPLRGLSPQDQRQTDLLFTVGVTVRP
jgi:hypothetical protein